MESFWGQLSVYSGMISTSVVAGGVVPVFVQWSRKQLHLMLAFSAGLMLGATLIHLLPASFELLGKTAPLWVLAGFLFLYVFEKFVTLHICEAFECDVHPMGIAAVLGISIHALTDGIALGSGLLVSELGLIVFLTIFFHKLPEAFALTTILINEGQRRGLASSTPLSLEIEGEGQSRPSNAWRSGTSRSERRAAWRGRIIFFNLLLIVMVPLGALLVHFVVGTGNVQFAGIALAFSAGTFLHVSLSDLLPHVHEHAENRLRVAFAFLVGIVVMIGLEKILQHSGHHL